MTAATSLLVFSDLDGTLLDHQSYSWEAARPGLERLRALGAGLVLASSKTAAELGPLRAELGFADWPAIVENGAGILWPGDSGSADDSAYGAIRAALPQLPTGFHGFGDMSAEDVAQITGLPLAEARRAKTRAFSEPGLWQGDEAGLAAFLQALPAHGLSARRGGRFLTLSQGRSKADAMAELVAHFKPRRTIALGDAPNDLEMLQAADHGVIVANPAAPDMAALPGEAQGRIIRTSVPGPAGWAAALLSLTSDFTNQGELPHG